MICQHFLLSNDLRGCETDIFSSAAVYPGRLAMLVPLPASGSFTASVRNECPHFLQNLASSRFGVSHDEQIILPLLLAITVVFVLAFLRRCLVQSATPHAPLFWFGIFF